MKKLTFIITAICCTCAVNCIGQISQFIKKSTAIKLQPGTNLTWYLNAIKPKTTTSSTSSNGSVLSTRTVSPNRVDIGVGLPQSNQPFTANGASRQSTTGDQTCTIQPMKVDYLGSSNFNLFTSENTIYPGQFFNINSVITNSFSAFSSPQRKPYQLGISIFNANNSANNMLEVTNLTRSPLPEIQSTLLAPNYGAAIPAEGILEMVKINSTLELKASMEASRGIFLPLEELGVPLDISASIDASASASSTTRLEYYMLNFYQPMYTINVLTNNDQMFQQADAHTTCANGAYVEAVTYGRRVIVIIGSAENETKVRAALSAALGASVTGGEAAGVKVGDAVSAETSSTLRNTAAKFFAKIYGGEGTVANNTFGDIVDFKNSFSTFIKSPSAGTFSARTGALPLHYTLRRISDNSLLSVRSVGSYDDVVSCNTATFKVEVLWKGFKVNSVVEAPLDDKEDIWGTLTVASATINGTNQNIGKSIKSIAKGSAISVKAGSTDPDDITVKVLENLRASQITNTTLNFNETIYDWEPLHNPEYKPNSSVELKFNLADKTNQINALQPGGTIIFDNPINLTETGPTGATSKITLLTKIKVTKI